jgi:hypothetical protein
MWPFPTAASSQRMIGHPERPLSSRLSSIKHHFAICPISHHQSSVPGAPSTAIRTSARRAHRTKRGTSCGSWRITFLVTIDYSGNSLHAHQPSSPPHSSSQSTACCLCRHHRPKPTINAPPHVEGLFSHTQSDVATITTLDPMSSLRDGGTTSVHSWTSGWEDAARPRGSE